MAYWLLKSEPSSYSWEKLVADGRTHWDGVRNAQALNNLRAMKLGDRAFFYQRDRRCGRSRQNLLSRSGGQKRQARNGRHQAGNTRRHACRPARNAG